MSNDEVIAPPSQFDHRFHVGKSFARDRVLALYWREFRARPRWLSLVVVTVGLALSAVVMLVLGGPVPWPWCAAWLAGCIWAVVPFGVQLRRNIRRAQSRDRQGDWLESAFDERAMWLRNGTRLNRFAFDEFELASSEHGLVFLRPRKGDGLGVIIPTDLFGNSFQESASRFG